MKFLSGIAEVCCFIALLFGLVFSPAQIAMNPIVGQQSNHIVAQTGDDLTGVTVGLYESYYSSTDARVRESRGALLHMLTWMNATVHVLNKTDIINGALWACEILVIPEGLGPFIERNLGNDGMDKIKEWIALGGSYVGVRGSAAMAVSDSYFEGSNTTFYMGLINGTSIGMPSFGHTRMADLSIIHNPADGPDLSEMPRSMSVVWQTGRYFVAAEGQEMITLATYHYNGEPAMVASRYGDGNVFLSSPHFEYEENNDRDGTDYRDSYDDPDSEWPLVLEVCKWMLEDSPNVVNTTTWTYPEPIETTTNTTGTDSTSQPLVLTIEMLAVVGALAGVVIIASVVIMKRRV
ncbi:MAG: BPL-N domain-containing protein [Candidatus Thorarchaeota archaeon]|jgi:glutamine amidotransferase-like uncharacterized protein